MKVKKLVVDYDYDFDLYGVVSAVKDYKLAWQINKSIEVDLMRQEDYVVYNIEQEVSVINYLNRTENSEFRLFKNKGFNQESINFHMVPEMKHFDYFILVKGIIHSFTQAELMDVLKTVKGIQLINHIDVNTLKSKDRFVF